MTKMVFMSLHDNSNVTTNSEAQDTYKYICYLFNTEYECSITVNALEKLK